MHVHTHEHTCSIHVHTHENTCEHTQRNTHLLVTPGTSSNQFDLWFDLSARVCCLAYWGGSRLLYSCGHAVPYEELTCNSHTQSWVAPVPVLLTEERCTFTLACPHYVVSSNYAVSGEKHLFNLRCVFRLNVFIPVSIIYCDTVCLLDKRRDRDLAVELDS